MESRTKWDTSIMTGDSIHNPETPDSLNVSLCAFLPYVVTVFFGHILHCISTKFFVFHSIYFFKLYYITFSMPQITFAISDAILETLIFIKTMNLYNMQPYLLQY